MDFFSFTMVFNCFIIISPIIQDGKFIGAVTHVLVNNPQEGYAVFGDIMIKQLKSIE